MQRRRFLHRSAIATSTLASAFLAGCTGAGGPGDPDPTPPDDGGSSPTPTDPPCPTVRDVPTHVCPGDDGPVSVARSAPSIPADDGSLTVTVENTTSGRVGLNPYAWGIHRRTPDGDWARVDDDRAYIELWRELAPGDRVRWHVASDADSENAGTTGNAIAAALDLDPGTYAWSVTLLPDGADERVAAVAGFHVTA